MGKPAILTEDGLDQHDGPGRLAALRAELGKRGLDGFVVPRADEHQGEYVPKRAQRLAWLTGFTGSAGVAVVLADKAAIFVDGRYTLQVQAETDTRLFAPLHLVDPPFTEWLAATLPADARLGYDPWLHTVDGVERLRAACDKAGAALVACPDNPLDAVWTNQPPPPLAPVVPYPIRFAGVESADKRRQAALALTSDKVHAAILAAPDSIAWLLNVRGGDVPFTPLPLSFAILHADATVQWFVDPRKLTPVLGEALGEEVAACPPAEFGPALDRLGSDRRRVRIDSAATPAWAVDRLRDAGAVIDRGGDPCALPKACKNDVELAGMRAAHRRDGAALTRFLAWLAETAPEGRVTEMDAARALEDFRRGGQYFQGLSFPTISGAGPNGAIVHYHSTDATNRRLESGRLYLVDSGAQYLDGTTDVTRTVAIGSVGDEERRRFTAVLKGHIALAAARFPAGTTGGQLDALARRALWADGLDYDHGTGHGVGCYLGVHEGPQRISKAGNGVALRPGMILSNEPGYYKNGVYGIRIENLVTVVEASPVAGQERGMLGFETLTLAPIDRHLVDRQRLDETEIAWLDAYHRTVRETLEPLLDPTIVSWLRDATHPL